MLNSAADANSQNATESVANSDDVISLRTLFVEEESNLLKFAFSFVGRRAVAEEIVQDVFLKLHACWQDVESPRAWIYRCVRNRALNHLRDSKREYWLGEAGGAGQDASAEVPGEEAIPEETLAKMESVAELRRAIRELSDKDRRLIELRYFQGLKYREIGQSVGMTVSNVGFRLHRVLQQLAKHLQARGIEE